MPIIKALIAVFGLRSASKGRLLGKVAQRWSGIWILLLVLDVMRIVRRHRSQVIARRVLKDGEVLVISNSVNSESQ